MAKFYVFRGRKVLWNLFVVVLLIAALFYIFGVDDKSDVNGAITSDGEDSVSQVVLVEPVTVRTIPTKFSEYKLEREQMRSRQVELLQNLAYDGHTEGERKEKAQTDLQELIAKISRETDIENLLKAQGYLDALVLLDQEAITVVIPVTLMREEAARIGELVHRLTGIRLEGITIVDETIGV
ncbi:MAG TPA: SpoIIIAH-like family protein [Limnochordia bacterium]|nr:SpoIIIAH-like family protein [Limnochordia bacterium]